MRVVQIPNGQFAENCYFVIDEATNACAIIDPGEEAGLIAHKLAAAGVQPVGIWLTHAHIDHVLGVPRLKADTKAPVHVHPADRVLYDHVRQQALAFGARTCPEATWRRSSGASSASCLRSPIRPLCTAVMDPKPPWAASATPTPSSPAPIASGKPQPTCLRCGAEVLPRPWGCKNPCPNCGFIYPLGDCSD